MSWQGIRGHDAVVDQFRRGLEQRRLATTFLFVGPEGIGKRTFALKLAQAMLCSRNLESQLEPCGTCPACTQVQSNSHPDLQIVQKPEDRAFIPVDVFIGDREHRMRTGLCRFMSLKPSDGKRRIAIIDDADWLNQEGANSLLKTLEEPSPGAVMILISTSLQRQLPTIRSRSQVVRFQPLSNDDVVACLLEIGAADTQEQAQLMASRGEGSVAHAIANSKEVTVEFRKSLWQALAQPAIDRGGLAKCINAFADAGGKDTPAKRAQLRIAFDAATEFYRAVARCGAARGLPDGEQALHVALQPELQEPVAKTLSQSPAWSETALELVDRCLDALRQVNANANLGILVDAWVADLATKTRNQR